MRRHQYEILLGSDQPTTEAWSEFCRAVSRFVPFWQSWRVQVTLDQRTLHYYLESPVALPASLDVDGFLLCETPFDFTPAPAPRGIMVNRWTDNLATIIGHLEATGRKFIALDLDFRRLGTQIYTRARLAQGFRGVVHSERLLRVSAGALLAVNFCQNPTFLRQKIPPFLKLGKITKLLSADATNALLELNAFPYFRETKYLPLTAYDFDRHSLVLGSSGAGKSKFLSALIHQIHATFRERYQVIVIDPHDALKDDLVDIADRCEVTFQNPEQSIDLFAATTPNINVAVELTLGLFKSLIASYNSRLERVLRYSTYLLCAAGEFNFATLRRVILEAEYREELLRREAKHLPTSVVQFFATDFLELKNQSYGEAIAPLVAFIDEMQMVPVFSEVQNLASVLDLLDQNFLNIFSLNQLILGHRVVQTIAGLVLQQIFTLAQRAGRDRHLVVVIDEVAVVESPILQRFLAELRKFQVSVILAGQFFAQISSSLRAAIFANVVNYYLFHVSKADANLLVENLDIKPARADSEADYAKLITKLKSRECLVRVGHDGELEPLFAAKTLDAPCLVPIPAKTVPTAILRQAFSEIEDNLETEFEFELGEIDALSIMQANTTSRKKLSF